jgi:hypothetical protein
MTVIASSSRDIALVLMSGNFNLVTHTHNFFVGLQNYRSCKEVLVLKHAGNNKWLDPFAFVAMNCNSHDWQWSD